MKEITPETLREKLLELEEEAKFLISEIKKDGKGEPIAQAILSLRHIEDARMRLGKVIQYSGDGVSIYNK